jgi:hypothetical protein
VVCGGAARHRSFRCDGADILTAHDRRRVAAVLARSFLIGGRKLRSAFSCEERKKTADVTHFLVATSMSLYASDIWERTWLFYADIG